MIRHCSKCGEDKDFYLGQAWCKNCIKSYQQTDKFKEQKRNYYQRKRSVKLLQLAERRLEFNKLTEGKCSLCPEDFPDCIQFHHKNPKTKLFDVSQMVGMKSETIKEELAKCVKLCANCHLKIHALLKENVDIDWDSMSL